jgi:biotin transporter BioY
MQWVVPWLMIFLLAGLVSAVLAHGGWQKRIAILILVPFVGTAVVFVVGRTIFAP